MVRAAHPSGRRARYDLGVRLLLLSDIHANHTALQAVLNDAAGRRYDQVIHLGDALGYGPHPREVLDALRDLDAICVLGNHDEMLLDYADGRRAPKDSTGSACSAAFTRRSGDDAAVKRSR